MFLKHRWKSYVFYALPNNCVEIKTPTEVRLRQRRGGSTANIISEDGLLCNGLTTIKLK